MTPKEKAKELVDKYLPHVRFKMGEDKDIVLRRAKQCAIIAVDEILNNDSVGISSDLNHLICDTDYWQEVKEEIENIKVY